MESFMGEVLSKEIVPVVLTQPRGKDKATR